MRTKTSLALHRQPLASIKAEWPAMEQGRALSVSEQIARNIGDMIVAGDYAPGERLVEEQIAVDFGVSRNPVREAFRIMERDGFVSISARKGAQVVMLTPEEARDLFEIEGELYGLMARRLASVTPNDEAIEILEHASGILDENLKQDAPCMEFLLVLNELSLHLSRLCGNDSLPGVLSLVLVRNVGYTRSSLTCRSRKARIIAQWRAMRDAVIAADAQQAEAAGRAIVVDMASAVMKIAAEAKMPKH